MTRSQYEINFYKMTTLKAVAQNRIPMNGLHHDRNIRWPLVFTISGNSKGKSDCRAGNGAEVSSGDQDRACAQRRGQGESGLFGRLPGNTAHL